MPKPDLARVPEFYHNYINQVPESDLMLAFKNGTRVFIDFLENIPPAKIDFAYAEGKWTVKEVLQHIIDGERVFAYRALRFARKDSTPLPGYDEKLFAKNAKAHRRSWNDLKEEFKIVRKASEWLFGSFDEEQLNEEGVSNNHPNYVLAFGYILVGHPLHHMRIIRERYFQDMV